MKERIEELTEKLTGKNGGMHGGTNGGMNGGMNGGTNGKMNRGMNVCEPERKPAPELGGFTGPASVSLFHLKPPNISMKILNGSGSDL